MYYVEQHSLSVFFCCGGCAGGGGGGGGPGGGGGVYGSKKISILFPFLSFTLCFLFCFMCSDAILGNVFSISCFSVSIFYS